MKSKLDKLFKEFINDSNYLILPTGEIFNAKNKKLGYIKKAESRIRNKAYFYVKYKNKEIKMHRIIYCKFVDELRKTKVIHHVDGNGLNNCVTNLEQVSQSDNNFARYEK